MALPSEHLERELGRSGMATVYLARDVRQGRPVAIKAIHPELAQAAELQPYVNEAGAGLERLSAALAEGA